MVIISTDDPVVVEAIQAIHRGDVEQLERLLRARPELATADIGADDECDGGGVTRTLLHVVTDWPGHFPNGAATVGALVAAGADVNARFSGPHAETPLHWAASSDDVDVLDALLDAGADIEARGAVTGGGTPMADATAFGQWTAAGRLLERGAETTLWEAAALGLLDRVRASFRADDRPPPDEVTSAFWGACHGGQQATAAYLLAEGADLDWIGYDNLTPLDAAAREAVGLVPWLKAQGAHTAAEVTGSDPPTGG